ncbi:hypothetical protein HMPREF0027_1550 [Actinobacillus ureae ATCC 25976]|uniref:Uncharacterized protein n=1 Tax=Actinobacillus ureae ATCC 25976 TaxID=887324 RepID=E8KI83_9PAST|nr:hypothetical protein HMPREF0027_1550 [Actinobacillus ureae ATCC 25976]
MNSKTGEFYHKISTSGLISHAICKISLKIDRLSKLTIFGT